MFTTCKSHFTEFTLAVVMTVVVNGAVLWSFDTVAQEPVQAAAGTSRTTVSLDTVTIVAQRS